jgi:hypothetical protein
MFSRKCVGLLLVILLATSAAFGQGVMGRIVGTVTDTTGAVVVGAKLELVDQATGFKKTGTSGADGKFVFLALNNGLYKLTVSMQGFQTAVYPDIKVDLGRTAEITAQLQIGQVQSEVVVEAAAEVLQTQTTAIEGGVQGRQLRGLPLNNRDVLDFVLLMPGAQQTGGTRYSTFDGLPKGALNITMDGINIQDNYYKSSSSGGYFTNIRPKQDAVEEIQVTTGNNTADNSGGGAVQIKFATRRGTNDWHGGLYEFFRDQGLNANLWANMRTTGTPSRRPTNHMNQYGGSIGGPLIKNKLFVFNNFEDFRFPSSILRTQTILNADALTGKYDYAGGAKQADVFGIVNAYNAANGTNLTVTPDPTIAAMLATINRVNTPANVYTNTIITRNTPSPYQDTIQWNSNAISRRFFDTLRLDYDISDKLRWNTVGNWNHFQSSPDALNSYEPPFPLAEVADHQGGQNGERYSLVTALNWTITPRLNYEFRIGRTSSISHFADGFTSGIEYPGGYGFAFSGLGLPNLFGYPGGGSSYQGLPSNRDSPVITIVNNFGYVLGKHTISFGTQLDMIKLWNVSYRYPGVPRVAIGYNGTYDNIVNKVFTTTSVAGGTSGDPGTAANLWATLVGRVSSVSASRNLNAWTGQYGDGNPYMSVMKQREVGVFAQDSWRATKTVTINYGLRFEVNGSFNNPTNTFVGVGGPGGTGNAGVWGLSGIDNLFKPGVMTGTTPLFYLQNHGFYASPKMFAPNFGLAWSPNYENKLWKAVFGGSGKTVFRGGYSISTTREGMYVFDTNSYNPPWTGQTKTMSAGAQFLTTQDAQGNYGPALLLSQFINSGSNPLSFPGTSYAVFPAAFGPWPMSSALWTFQSGSMVQAIKPDLKMPYVQAWSFGLQRELSSNMVLEARYQGNHGTRLWTDPNLNEVNIFENGFLNEFRLAQNNQAICQANATACKAAQGTMGGISSGSQSANSFGDWGVAGQVPLPIMTTAWGIKTNASGVINASTNVTSYFNSSTYWNYIMQGQAGYVAAVISQNATMMCRMAGYSLTGCQPGYYFTAGQGAWDPVTQTTSPGPGKYPANFWVANPDVTAAYLASNGGDSFYDALQVELRRRMSKGLMIQGNYTFSKSLSNLYGDSTNDGYGWTTLRNPRLDRGYSPYDIKHTARVFWTWELPFGPGRHFAVGNKVLGKIAEGWEFSGIGAFQSGRVFKLSGGRYTVNYNADNGIMLNGITPNQLQKMITVNKSLSSFPSANCAQTALTSVYFLPASLIGSDCRALNWDPALLNGVVVPTQTAGANNIGNGVLQAPYIPGQFGRFVYLHGPKFIKPDLTVAKQTKITERVNARFEARFFNALNITNFMVGSATSTANGLGLSSTSFGRTTQYYQDNSQSQDPGPRMIELVLRINF